MTTPLGNSSTPMLHLGDTCSAKLFHESDISNDDFELSIYLSSISSDDGAIAYHLST